MKYINYNFENLTDGEFTIQTNNTVTAMTDNPDFASPPHKMGDVKVKFEEYKPLCKDRENRSPADTWKRDTVRKELQKMLRENGMYIIALYPDDEEKQKSSGYPPVKEKDTSGTPPTPTDIKVRLGKLSGEAIVSFKKCKNARSYQINYRILGSTAPFLSDATGKCTNNIIKGLQPGQMYEFWACAIGAKHDSAPGGPAQLRIV